MRGNNNVVVAKATESWVRLVALGMTVAALELLASTGFVVLAYWGDLVGYERSPVTRPAFDATPLAMWMCVRAAAYLVVIVVLWHRVRPAMRSDPRTPIVVRTVLATCLIGILFDSFTLFFLGMLAPDSLAWLWWTAQVLNLVLIVLAASTKVRPA